jgi:hypothetical protein
MLAHGRLLASRGFHSLNQIEVKPNSATVAGNWEFERENWVLNSSSALNQINDQHDDRDDEQEMDQTAANVTKQTKEPEHEQDNNYSPKHG